MYIYSMSRKLKDTGADLDSKARTLILHLIKIVLYPYHKAQNHWFQEIYSAINDIDFIKGSNKLPKSEFIYHNITINHLSKFNKYIDIILKDYGDSDCTISNDDILFYVQEYCRWLSAELSENGVISKTDVYEHLSDIVEDVKVNFAN